MLRPTAVVVLVASSLVLSIAALMVLLADTALMPQMLLALAQLFSLTGVTVEPYPAYAIATGPGVVLWPVLLYLSLLRLRPAFFLAYALLLVTVGSWVGVLAVGGGMGPESQLAMIPAMLLNGSDGVYFLLGGWLPFVRFEHSSHAIPVLGGGFVIDIIVLALLAVSFVLGWKRYSLPKASILSCIPLIGLTVSVRLFDPTEFGEHFASVLVPLGLGFLTNPVLLIASVLVSAVAVVYCRRQGQ